MGQVRTRVHRYEKRFPRLGRCQKETAECTDVHRMVEWGHTKFIALGEVDVRVDMKVH
jgi:hypothetical protein